MDKVFIAEIAGKDSISAIIHFINNNSTNSNYTIIPTIVYTGTEYGRIESYTESIEFLKNLERSNVHFTETCEIHNEILWNILNAKYQYLIFKKFNFFTPCITCHLFTHLLRVPLYINNNSMGLITGERLSHGGNVKINQHAYVLNFFRELFFSYGINVIQPVLNISDTNIVNNIINNQEIISHANDTKCILSNNLSGFSLENSESYESMKYYFSEYVVPLGTYCLENMVKTQSIDMIELEKLIREILL